jgi:hypothetical protein
MANEDTSASVRRRRHQQARAELLARSAHKARLQGRTSLTLPLTAVPGQGEYDIVLADALQGVEVRKDGEFLSP